MTSNVGNCQNSIMADHRGEQKMYHSMCRQVCRLRVSNSVHGTVRDWQTYARNLRTSKVQQKLWLLSPARPSEFVVIDITRPLPKAKSERRYSLMMTGRCYTLTKEIPGPNTTAPTETQTLINDCVSNMGIPSNYLPTIVYPSPGCSSKKHLPSWR